MLGIGFNIETIPTWRTYVNIPIHIAQPSDEDTVTFLQVRNGVSLFDFDE